MTSLTTKLLVNYFYDIEYEKNKDGLPRQLMDIILSYRTYSDQYEEIKAGFIPKERSVEMHKAIYIAIEFNNIAAIKYFLLQKYIQRMPTSSAIKAVQCNRSEILDMFIVAKIDADWNTVIGYALHYKNYNAIRSIISKTITNWTQPVFRKIRKFYKCYGLNALTDEKIKDIENQC